MNANTDIHQQLVRQYQAELEAAASAERALHPSDSDGAGHSAGGLRVRVGRSLISIGRALAGDEQARAI